MTIGAIVQARMGSSRLPGKSLMDICGKPAIQRVIERVQHINGLDTYVVAVPNTKDDEPLIELITSLGIPIYLGSELDVLDRYYGAAKEYSLDVIMRITGDCPLLDPAVSQRVLDRYIYSTCDYASNVHPASFPDGLDTEVFSFWALSIAHKNASDPYDREHVTPYMYRPPSPFRLANVWNLPGNYSTHRWTLDTEEDLNWIRTIYRLMGTDMFSMNDLLELISQRPDISFTSRE